MAEMMFVRVQSLVLTEVSWHKKRGIKRDKSQHQIFMDLLKF